MNIELLFRPANTISKITLLPNESITAESGAMMAMSADIDLKTTTHKKESGSFLSAMKRIFAGESFFLNHFTASAKGGEILLSSDTAGDMMVHQLNGETLIVAAGGFVAKEDSLEMTVGWQGMASFFSGEGLFWLKIKGMGKVILNSFGSIYEVEVNDSYIVDTSHIVAFEETLSFSITKGGNTWLSAFLGGEGLVCKFSGKGKVFCQSHNLQRFGEGLRSLLKPKER
jgi:uncharacterized protein (TIGR00266 family)